MIVNNKDLRKIIKETEKFMKQDHEHKVVERIVTYKLPYGDLKIRDKNCKGCMERIAKVFG